MNDVGQATSSPQYPVTARSFPFRKDIERTDDSDCEDVQARERHPEALVVGLIVQDVVKDHVVATVDERSNGRSHRIQNPAEYRPEIGDNTRRFVNP